MTRCGVLRFGPRSRNCADGAGSWVVPHPRTAFRTDALDSWAPGRRDNYLQRLKEVGVVRVGCAQESCEPTAVGVDCNMASPGCFPLSVGFGPVPPFVRACWRSPAQPMTGRWDRHRPDGGAALVELLPHAGPLPFARTKPRRHAGTVTHLLRLVFPGDAGPEREPNTGEDPPVRNSRPFALGLGGLARQEWLDDRLQLAA